MINYSYLDHQMELLVLMLIKYELLLYIINHLDLYDSDDDHDDDDDGDVHGHGNQQAYLNSFNNIRKILSYRLSLRITKIKLS